MRAPVILHPALTQRADDPRAQVAADAAGGEWVVRGRLVVLRQHAIPSPAIPANVTPLRVPAFLQKGMR